MGTPDSEAATAANTAAPSSRAASLWPETTRQGGGASSSFVLSRFDPLADERARLQAQAAAAFDVCHPALALRALLLVQAVLAVVALALAEGGWRGWLALQGTMAYGGVAAALLWLVTVCAVRRPLARLAAAPRAGVVLLLGSAAALLAWWPLAWLGAIGAGDGFRIAAVALAGAGLAALLWAWLDLRSRIWHPANASARLAELQSRIRPHFLFNALNTALALVRVDPARAEAVLEDLAELFRTALAEVGASVALADEIELARRYLAIEQIRFGERLAVDWRIEPDPRVAAARVPPLVLQPLVENAVRHGIETMPRGGRVIVAAGVHRGQVVLTVSNTVGPEGAARPGHGMALHNVRERLRLLHDVAADVEVRRESTPGGDLFHARIVLPLA